MTEGDPDVTQEALLGWHLLLARDAGTTSGGAVAAAPRSHVRHWAGLPERRVHDPLR